MKKTLILSALLATTSITAAMADDNSVLEQKAHWWFSQVDANHDGQITQAEHSSFGTQMFAEADTNHDGKLSYEEVLAEKELERSRMDKDFGKTALSHDNPKLEQLTRWYFNQVDVSHDGQITPEEHAAFNQAMFAEADTNHDGSLSYDEVLAEKKLEMSRFKDIKQNPDLARGEHLPNRVNANPSDRTINKGAPEGVPNNKYLSK